MFVTRAIKLFHLVLSFTALLTGVVVASDRPNILLIMADDLGYSDLGSYGGEIKTPNLDRLAAEGARFTQAYNMAKCEPTRNSMMAGQRNTPQIGFFAERANQWLAEEMARHGYGTYMTGKWHVSGNPLDRGFERFYGLEEGGCDYFTGSTRDGEGRIRYGRDLVDVPEDWYATDAFTDYAINFLKDHPFAEKPFFMYVAYTAPHDPLQAPIEDIDRYRGKYDVGYHSIQEGRYQRLVELGLLPENHVRPDWPQNLPRWEDLNPRQQRMESLRMEVYAAMVDRMDQNIGRLVSHLESIGQLDNTLIIFMSDNGANAFDRRTNNMLSEGIRPDQRESAWSTGPTWAHVSNTPFRLYKRNMHEGGICTPFVVRWPSMGFPVGSLTDLPIHVLDFMPTFIGLAGAADQIPEKAEGSNLAQHLIAGDASRPDFKIIDYLVDHRVVRRGDWKMVSVDGEPWELYNLADDRSEVRDLANEMPEVMEQLKALWDADWSQMPNQPADFSERRGTPPALRMGDRGSGNRYRPAAAPEGW